MSMKVKFLQNASNFKVYAKLNGIERLTKRAVRRGMFKWAKDLKATANQQILAKDKEGIVYLRRTPSGRRRRHRASAPGQSHANRTGALRKSIGWNVTGSDRLEFGYGVDGKDTPLYAPFIEFGTFRMKPRPSLQNAINSTLGNAETYFKEELDKLNES